MVDSEKRGEFASSPLCRGCDGRHAGGYQAGWGLRLVGFTDAWRLVFDTAAIRGSELAKRGQKFVKEGGLIRLVSACFGKFALFRLLGWGEGKEKAPSSQAPSSREAPKTKLPPSRGCSGGQDGGEARETSSANPDANSRRVGSKNKQSGSVSSASVAFARHCSPLLAFLRGRGAKAPSSQTPSSNHRERREWRVED